ncbi:MAG TPA: ABC transporter permease [Vicinamibacteria bacterium]|nr:ABC transporter permease [Vicinamibacteria bacterium]
MDALRQDLRFAVRTLAASPGFTAVALLTLALGIGANTAIFTLMDQVMFRLLPVHEPERLVLLDGPGPFSGSTHSHSATVTEISHPLFLELRDKADVFDGVLAQYTTPVHLGEGGQTDRVDGVLVSGTFFDVLGLRPAAGRLLTPDDDRAPGAHPVAVLGHGFWTRRFAADPAVVGRGVHVNGHPMTVIGVAPAGFHGISVGESIDVYLPLMMQPQVIPTWTRGINDWRVRWLTSLARLRDGVSVEQAGASVNVLYSQLLKEDLERLGTRSERFRTAFLQKKLLLHPGGRGASGLRDLSRTPLLMLMGMVGLVLLIACANVANLLLARASSRQKEVALRLALGASRWRLVRQLLVECLVLSLAGGALGFVVASWTGGLLVRALPSAAAARVLTSDPDLRVGLFALALSVATGLLFGLVPALQSTRMDLAPTLKNESTSVLGGAAPFRFRKALVVAQVALSLLLLIGAGLFTRSLMNLRGLDPGFQPQRLLAFSVDPSLNGYPTERRRAVLEEIRDEVAAVPGARSVSLAEVALMTDSNNSSTVKVEGYEAKDGEDMNPNFNAVAPEFFATLGIDLLAGRDFTDADALGAPRVAVVNETFARYFFGDQDPLGRRFGYGRDDELDIEIVGVVKDGRAANLREKPIRFVYVPYRQQPDVGEMTFYARTTLDPEALAPGMREIVRRVDATLPVTHLKTMRAQIGESLFVERLVAALSAAFGLLATLLAALGLYGVMSYAVSLRTREIGIRVALGADRRTVLAMVLREVAILALIGLAVGLPGGYGLGRLVETQLFGLSANDPLTFALATVTLLATALLAGYLPAARATRVHPMVALRYQ